MKYSSIKKQARTALFTSLISVLSVITIPLPSGIPFTLQTFSVALSGFCLGSKYGTESVLLYLAIGGLGFPVFGGMSGGLSKLTGITGGFLIGFLFIPLFCNIKTGGKQKLFYSFIGLFICHFIGILVFSAETNLNITESAALASIPYIPKDIISYTLAFILSEKVKNLKFFGY